MESKNIESRVRNVIDTGCYRYNKNKWGLTLIDLTEDDYTGEFCLWIVRNGWVVDEDAHVPARFGGDVFVGFFDQHVGGIVCAVRRRGMFRLSSLVFRLSSKHKGRGRSG